MVTKEIVLKVLKDVYDPEIPINIVDMGLIYGVDIVGDKVQIRMTLTSPGCPMAGSITEEVKQAAMKAAQYCKSQGSDLSLLAMQWMLQQEKVATTLVGMSKLSELKINLKALESGPDPVLLAEVTKILSSVQGRC